MLGVDDGKQQIMNRLTIEQPGPMFCHFPLDEAGVMTNRGYDALYFRGLISEHRKTIKKNGEYREVWEPTTGVRNEPLDLRNYNLACMQTLHPDWDGLAARGRANLLEGTETVARTEKRKKNHRKKPVKASSGTQIW